MSNAKPRHALLDLPTVHGIHIDFCAQTAAFTLSKSCSIAHVHHRWNGVDMMQEFFSAPFQKTLALVDEQKKAHGLLTLFNGFRRCC